MKWWLRGSSSRGSKENENEERKKPKYNLPRTTEVRLCEWPSDAFLRETGIYEDFYYLVENAGITVFLHDKCDQYHLLTNTFVQNFHFRYREDPPMVEFHWEWLFMTFAMFANYLMRAVIAHKYRGSQQFSRVEYST